MGYHIHTNSFACALAHTYTPTHRRTCIERSIYSMHTHAKDINEFVETLLIRGSVAMFELILKTRRRVWAYPAHTKLLKKVVI